jgi:hypothetical protein
MPLQSTPQPLVKHNRWSDFWEIGYALAARNLDYLQRQWQREKKTVRQPLQKRLP